MRLAGSIALCALAAALIAGCSDSKPSGSGTSTATPADARLPLILERDTLVLAAADGSSSREEPATYDPSRLEGKASPNGRYHAVFEAGKLIVIENGERNEIADVGSFAEFANVLWSPDSSHLLFDVAFDGNSPDLYVVGVDGAGLTDVGADLTGDAVPEAWSPDGARIAFGVISPSVGAPPRAQMYVANAGGSDRQPVGEFLVPQGDAGWDAPAWSPDGNYIALAHGDSGMRVLDLAGGPARDLGGQGVIHFSWAPDSSAVVFDNRGGFDPILIGDIATSTSRELTSGFWPRWSPRGDRIAFKRNVEKAEAFSVLTDGSGLASLGDLGPSDRSEMTWSDDGSELRYTRAAPRDGGLYAIDPSAATATRAPQSLTELGYAPLSQPLLSPDGTRLVFFGVGAGKDDGSPSAAGAFVLEIATGEVTQLTGDIRTGPVYWDGDTPRIALASATAGVFVAEPGVEPRQVSRVEAFRSPAWSPDGTQLAILGPLDISVVDINSGAEHTIELGLTAGADALQNLQWSPDGGALLYEVGHNQGFTGASTDAYVVDPAGGEPRLLLHVLAPAAYATWSPGGAIVAFIRPGETTVEVWLIDASGANERRPAAIEAWPISGSTLFWSPDGTKIATVVNNTDVYVIDATSGAATFVATNAAACSMTLAGWLPDSSAFYAIPQCGLAGI